MAEKEEKVKKTRKTKTRNTVRGMTFIVGASRLGASMAAILNEQNSDVMVIDKDPMAFNKLPDSYGGGQSIGDALDTDFLVHLGVDSAQRVILVTEDDNVNLLLSLICCHIYKIPRIYLRLHDVTKANLLKNTHIRAFFPFNSSMADLIKLMEEEV